MLNLANISTNSVLSIIDLVAGILERESNVIHIIAGRLIDLSERIEGLKNDARDFH